MAIILNLIKNMRHAFCSAVVVAAGSSTRMGEDKLLLTLGDKPVLAHTLYALNQCEALDEIVVVTRQDLLDLIASIKMEYKLDKVTRIVIGGATRLESSLAGVTETSNKARIICIHDGARPFVTPEIVEEVIHQAKLYHAATPAVPISDTVKTAEGGIVTGTPDRSSVFAIQTPQAFQADIIKAALTRAVQDGKTYSDDCGAVEALGVKVHLTTGSRENIKITTPTDLIMAKMILMQRGGESV